jgi:hypothetical protein
LGHEEQADILQGSAIGKIVQDRQAMSALVALMYNREKYEEIKKAVIEAQNSKGIETNYETVSVASKAEFGALATEINNSFYDALNPTINILGDFAQSTANAMTKYPAMSRAVVGTGAALVTLAAMTTLASMVMGKNILTMNKWALGIASAAAVGYALGTGLREVAGYAMDKFGLGNLATTIDNTLGEGIALILARFGVSEAENAIQNNDDAEQALYNEQKDKSEALINDIVERAGYQPINLNATFQVDGSTLATIVQSYQVKDLRRN